MARPSRPLLIALFLLAAMCSAPAAKHPGNWRKIQDGAAEKALRAEVSGKGSICFTSNRDGNWEIYVCKPDGSDQKNVSNNPAGDMGARWTADGRIIFHSDRDNPRKIKDLLRHDLSVRGYPWQPEHQRNGPDNGLYREMGIYVMNADGSGVKQLAKGGINPAMSPDGKWLVFERDDRIVIMNISSGKTHLAQPPMWGASWFPSFSPDGKRLLSVACTQWARGNERKGYQPAIFYLDENMKPMDKYWITATGGEGCHPEWSSDGNKIVFCQDTRGSTFGWIDVNESAKKDKWLQPKVIDIGLDKDKHILACPDWSPDARYFVFSIGPVHFEVKPQAAKSGFGEPWNQRGQLIYQELAITRVDGGAWIQLTEGGYANRDPDWKP